MGFIYYGYVFWVLWRKKQVRKKNPSKFDSLQINNIFVNNSDNKNTDLEALLNQVKEVEDHSKLLDAFKKEPSEEASYSLTLKKNEKLKIVRDDSSSDPSDDPKS
jgi:hypothetical protein